MSKRSVTPEGSIQKLILDWLAAKHVFAIRMNTGAVAGEYKGKKRFMRFGVPGMADILAFFPKQVEVTRYFKLPFSMPVWIEVKAPDGKQSELQKSFQAKVESEGHRYILARSLEDVEKAFI